MYRKITYVAGNTREIIKFYTRSLHPAGVKFKKKTPEEMERGNTGRMIRNVNRILNANFAKGDMYYTLTYSKRSGCPASEEELGKAVQAHMRRLQGWVKKEGGEFKYLYVISMGKGGRTPHAHVVTNIPLGYERHEELVRRAWIKKDATMEDILSVPEKESSLVVYDKKGYPALMNGFIRFKTLWEEGQYMGLAEYLVSHKGYAKGAGKEGMGEGAREEADREAGAEGEKEHKRGEEASKGEENGREREGGNGSGQRKRKPKLIRHSHNLEIPQPKVEDIKADKFNKRIAIPKGYRLLPGSVKQDGDEWPWPYFRYTLIKIPGRGGPPGDKRSKERCLKNSESLTRLRKSTKRRGRRKKKGTLKP